MKIITKSNQDEVKITNNNTTVNIPITSTTDGEIVYESPIKNEEPHSPIVVIGIKRKIDEDYFNEIEPPDYEVKKARTMPYSDMSIKEEESQL